MQREDEVRVAVVGIGNCAHSFVQGVLGGVDSPQSIAAPMDNAVKSIPIKSIGIVAAFDVDRRKVGRDLAEAVCASPNCTTSYLKLDRSGVTVSCGPLSDGIAEPGYTEVLPIAAARDTSWDHVADALRQSGSTVVLNFLPVGAQKASEGYARSAAKADAHFINCTPSIIGRSRDLQELFADRKRILLGDDLKSHVGASAIHGTLVEFLERRGIKIDSMYQLNFGGNADFRNMLSPTRVETKRQTKRATIECRLREPVPMTIGPSGYIEHLKDNKVCYLNVVGRGYLGMPFNLDLKLMVEDSPRVWTHSETQ